MTLKYFENLNWMPQPEADTRKMAVTSHCGGNQRNINGDTKETVSGAWPRAAKLEVAFDVATAVTQ